MYFDKKIKKLDTVDMGLTKLAVAAFVLFVLTIWPSAMRWVVSVDPLYFCIAWILLAVRPIYKFFN